jgi:hypothetical protein
MPPIVVRIEPKMFPRTSSLLRNFLSVAVAVQCSNRWVEDVWFFVRFSPASDSCGRKDQLPKWCCLQTNQSELLCDGEFKIMSVISRV